jgi:hypothetical protein
MRDQTESSMIHTIIDIEGLEVLLLKKLPLHHDGYVSDVTDSTATLAELDNDSFSFDDHDQCEQRSVRFSNVQVRLYASCVGDHPHTRYFPISLDWGHTESVDTDINEYEESRSACNQVRRTNFGERMARIAHVNGLSTYELKLQEQQRIERLELEQVMNQVKRGRTCSSMEESFSKRQRTY